MCGDSDMSLWVCVCMCVCSHDGAVWQVAWAHPKFGNILASCSYDRKVSAVVLSGVVSCSSHAALFECIGLVRALLPYIV